MTTSLRCYSEGRQSQVADYCVRGRTKRNPRPTVITLSTAWRSSIRISGLRRFPAMAIFIVSIFVVIIVGSASAFAYVVLADGSGRTGP